jgi:hypothetical protein
VVSEIIELNTSRGSDSLDAPEAHLHAEMESQH